MHFMFASSVVSSSSPDEANMNILFLIVGFSPNLIGNKTVPRFGQAGYVVASVHTFYRERTTSWFLEHHLCVQQL